MLILGKKGKDEPSSIPNQQSLQPTFDQLFRDESNAIFRFCLFRVSDKEQAMDLVQETFLRLWKTMNEGTTVNNCRAFLFTIAHRLIIDWYRKKKTLSLDAEEEREGGGETSTDPADEITLPDRLELAAEGRYLMTKITELAPSNRQAVYLRYVEGLSPGEIGDILGISANAASVRVNRALAELRKISGYEHIETEANETNK